MSASRPFDRPIRLALVGIGKIARDQHAPAISRSARFELAATASPHSGLEGVARYRSVEALIASGIQIDAVSLCTPPQGRHALAAQAIEAGLHVMLEKPPAATVSEAQDLVARAKAKGVTLFATWHSREAAAVDAARRWLGERSVKSAHVTWREDIRVWHPGQEWILDAGGLGVFDPGINALSIVTHILHQPMVLQSAELSFPEGRHAPLCAQLAFAAGSAPVTFDLDFLQTGPQSWDIEVKTDDGVLSLTQGGARLLIDGVEQIVGEDHEYERLYARFADLIGARQIDADLAPLQHVADVFLAARRLQTERFAF